MNEKVVEIVFPKEIQALRENKCPFCLKEVRKEDCTTEREIAEFEISGLCPKCQDEAFN